MYEELKNIVDTYEYCLTVTSIAEHSCICFAFFYSVYYLFFLLQIDNNNKSNQKSKKN